jgi:hypothetical protein
MLSRSPSSIKAAPAVIAMTTICQRLRSKFRASASSLRCLAAYLVVSTNRAVDPRDLPLQVKLLQSAIVVIQAVNAGSFERANLRGDAQQQLEARCTQGVDPGNDPFEDREIAIDLGESGSVAGQ